MVRYLDSCFCLIWDIVFFEGGVVVKYSFSATWVPNPKLLKKPVMSLIVMQENDSLLHNLRALIDTSKVSWITRCWAVAPGWGWGKEDSIFFWPKS